MTINEMLDSEEYWSLTGEIWTDSENIWQHYGDWRKILESNMPQREHMMDENERKALEALPDTIEVYRGYKIGYKDGVGSLTGFSWTTDKERAEWFSKRLLMDGTLAAVMSGTMDKKNVIAHFLGRGEDEIVTLPEWVQIDKEEA